MAKDGSENTGRVNVSGLLDEQPFSPRLIAFACLLTLVLVVDGFELVLLGFVAPAVSHEFGLSPVGIGGLLTISQVGVAIGGLSGGMAGDRIGRRKALLLAVLTFAGASMLCALTTSLWLFGIGRIVAGLGMGAATPNVATYFTEILPTAWRSRMSVLAFAASTLGGTICAMLTSFLMPVVGWRGMFWAGGLLPLLIVLPLLLVLLPESPRFLVTARSPAAAVARTLNKLLGGNRFTGSEIFEIHRAAKVRGRIRQAFAREFRRDTAALWLLAFAIMFSSVGILNIGALVLSQSGFSQTDAVRVLLFYNIAGLAGAFASFLAIHALGSRATLILLLGIGAIGLFGLAFASVVGAGGHFMPTILLFILTGFGMTSSIMVVFPLASQAYPTEFRSSGAGAAIGFGRIGSTISAIVLAAILAKASASGVFVMLALMTLVGIAAVVVLRRHIAATAVKRNVAR